MEAWEEDCWALARTACPNYEYVTGEDLMEVYWRTLIFNTSHWQTRPGPEYEKYWHIWLSMFCNLNKVRAIFDAFKRGDPDSQPVRALGRYPTLTMLNTILAVIYYFFRPRKAWHWLLASSIFAVVNWDLSNGMFYPSKNYIEIMRIRQEMKSHQRFGDPFTEAFERFSYGRKFCITASGYIGWVPSTAQSGDFVCFLESGSIPFIIRKCEGGYCLLGDSYLHGLMDRRRFLEHSGSDLIKLV
ncbi:MAG: hypothetical protein MMC33_010437 [Icmadophila ericetorum]|nr:hypothetical protein [Icmadophila ericetorum]